ncbi:AAA-type ATPase family protein [Actinidia rufa]|uniref:AAA-type ATPase family protein n=1 Tax=Actinidia rufa TaxID=165716 RepID=A0A7J0F1S5_9ERIC|nr:AAA-type ATPase family protein [Actinidia rufa]
MVGNMISSLTVDGGILFSEHKVDHKAPEIQVFYSTQEHCGSIPYECDLKGKDCPRISLPRECADFISGKVRDLREVDSSSKKGIDRVRHILKNIPVRPSSAFSQYQIFIIDECHLLPSKMWMAFLKFLEQPPPRAVFIFMMTDLDNVLRTVLSRCQIYLFKKIKYSDIVARLRKISADENLDVESDALDLIALNADGSLRDAETMLDHRVIRKCRNSEKSQRVDGLGGVDPMVLMSQLATLIMDIIAGTYQVIDSSMAIHYLMGEVVVVECPFLLFDSMLSSLHF